MEKPNVVTVEAWKIKWKSQTLLLLNHGNEFVLQTNVAYVNISN
jgi:hypothetical protein